MQGSHQGSPVLITAECHRARPEDDLRVGDCCGFLIGSRYDHKGPRGREQKA